MIFDLPNAFAASWWGVLRVGVVVEGAAEWLYISICGICGIRRIDVQPPDLATVRALIHLDLFLLEEQSYHMS